MALESRAWSRVCEIPLVLPHGTVALQTGQVVLYEREPWSDCTYPACTNGDTQAINAAGSPNVHTDLHSVQKVNRGKGKMVGEQPCPMKQFKGTVSREFCFN